MAVFLVTSAIVGMLLGLRFKVLVLVPASVKLSVVALTLVGTLVSLQVGYAVWAPLFDSWCMRTCRHGCGTVVRGRNPRTHSDAFRRQEPNVHPQLQQVPGTL